MVISRCDKCKPHPYQDKEYGDKMRVMNPCGKLKESLRCTVCGEEKLSPKGPAPSATRSGGEKKKKKGRTK